MLIFLLAWEFWIVLIAIAGLILASADEKNEAYNFTSFGIVILMFVALHYLADFSIVTWTRENPGALWFLPFYFVIGTVWSVLKWYLLLKEKYAEAKEDWARIEKSNTNSNSFDHQSFSNLLKCRMPKASRYRDRITYWINFWPASMLWTSLHEVFEKIAVRIYNAISGVYDRLSKRIFRFEEDKNSSDD